MSLRSFFASAGGCKNLISKVVNAFGEAARIDTLQSTSVFRLADGNQRDRDMRKYLAELVETGLLCCASRLEKDRAQVDIQRLMRDFSAAKKAFLRN
jgi:hypothetical protein